MNYIFTIIEGCNYTNFPHGGQLNFAKQLMSVFGNQINLVGIVSDKQTPIGKWIKKDFGGVEYDFFGLYRIKPSSKKPIIPLRIMNFLSLFYYQNKIRKRDQSRIFVQSAEFLLALKSWKGYNICYRFPGVENPLAISRYKLGLFLAKYYDRIFFPLLRSCNTILASANNDEIASMVERSKGVISRLQVIQFLTRVNTDTFCKKDKSDVRKKLGIDINTILVVTSGRLGYYKGWKFQIDCFLQFNHEFANSIFYFLGDGEEKNRISEYIEETKSNDVIFLYGFIEHETLSMFLSAADLYIMGSYKEGWSTSLVEATACGVPACVTDFSSANEIIKEGKTGFVIKDRDINKFVLKMKEALDLDMKSVENALDIGMYSLSTLRQDLIKAWSIEI